MVNAGFIINSISEIASGLRAHLKQEDTARAMTWGGRVRRRIPLRLQVGRDEILVLRLWFRVCRDLEDTTPYAANPRFPTLHLIDFSKVAYLVDLSITEVGNPQTPLKASSSRFQGPPPNSRASMVDRTSSEAAIGPQYTVNLKVPTFHEGTTPSPPLPLRCFIKSETIPRTLNPKPRTLNP